jgi:hypothetical protein
MCELRTARRFARWGIKARESCEFPARGRQFGPIEHRCVCPEGVPTLPRVTHSYIAARYVSRWFAGAGPRSLGLHWLIDPRTDYIHVCVYGCVVCARATRCIHVIIVCPSLSFVVIFETCSYVVMDHTDELSIHIFSLINRCNIYSNGSNKIFTTCKCIFV